jgi:hypothetical protein
MGSDYTGEGGESADDTTRFFYPFSPGSTDIRVQATDIYGIGGNGPPVLPPTPGNPGGSGFDPVPPSGTIPGAPGGGPPIVIPGMPGVP